MKVLIIVPAYNEGENIERVITSLREKCPMYDYVIRSEEHTSKNNTQILIAYP